VGFGRRGELREEPSDQPTIEGATQAPTGRENDIEGFGGIGGELIGMGLF
jgi:hypothetical protein